MPPLNLLVANLRFASAPTISAGINYFIADRNVVWSFSSLHWASFQAWLSQPQVLAVLMAWWITFIVFVTIILSIGFGPAGVVAGSMAAAFQTWMYGGFTPAGGLFATLTSFAMLGILAPLVVLVGAFFATLVAVIVWRFQ